jgi:hypothetical protein
MSADREVFLAWWNVQEPNRHTTKGLTHLAWQACLAHVRSTYTCFHCGEVFVDTEAARLHFGKGVYQQPGCHIDLAEYRRMEEENRRHCEEDTDLHRTLHRLECDHQLALRREEEAGYANGLRDGLNIPKGFIVINKALLAEAISCNTDASFAEASHIINTALKASDDAVFRAQLALEDKNV